MEIRSPYLQVAAADRTPAGHVAGPGALSGLDLPERYPSGSGRPARRADAGVGRRDRHAVRHPLRVPFGGRRGDVKRGQHVAARCPDLASLLPDDSLPTPPDIDVASLLRDLRDLADSLAGRAGSVLTPEQARALADRASQLLRSVEPAVVSALVESLQGVRDAANDIAHHYDADRDDAEAAAARARHLQTRARALAERLAGLDEKDLLVQGNGSTPDTPTLGRKLFAGADLRQWSEGVSWVQAPQVSSFRIGVSGGVSSTHSVGSDARDARAGDPRPGLACCVQASPLWG